MWCRVLLAIALLHLVAAKSVQDCQRMCQMILRPVCGSDGITYPNQCHLDVAICEAEIAGKTLKKVADGACKKTRAVDSNKTCVFKCAKIYDPVCGSDGLTYSNACILDQAICEAGSMNKKLSKAYDGPCKVETEKSKAGVDCRRPCPRHYEPVCGSDGVTYSNDCLLDIAVCESKSALKLDYKGVCCPIMCTMEYMPVCGSNGHTYSNDCELEVESCLSAARGGDVIKIASLGSC